MVVSLVADEAKSSLYDFGGTGLFLSSQAGAWAR